MTTYTQTESSYSEKEPLIIVTCFVQYTMWRPPTTKSQITWYLSKCKTKVTFPFIKISHSWEKNKRLTLHLSTVFRKLSCCVKNKLLWQGIKEKRHFTLEWKEYLVKWKPLGVGHLNYNVTSQKEQIINEKRTRLLRQLWSYNKAH